MTESIDKYLLENGEKITNPSQLTRGEVYFEDFAKGYRGFIMPGPERISENGHLKLLGIPVFEIQEIELDGEGKIRFATVDLEPHHFDDEKNGHSVFRAREGSEIRKTLTEKLPRVY